MNQIIVSGGISGFPEMTLSFVFDIDWFVAIQPFRCVHSAGEQGDRLYR